MTRYLALTAACLMLGACGSGPGAASAPAAAPSSAVAVDEKTRQDLRLEVAPAESGPVAAPIIATGQLQVNEDRTWKVGAITEGRIVAVPVRLGETVAAGQVVAEMHSHQVHDARATRRQAIADRDRLRVMAEQARRTLDRTRRLFELKAASREQLEAAETQSRSAVLSVTNAEAEVSKADTHLTEFLDVPLDAPGGPNGADVDAVPIKSPAAGTIIERLATVGSVAAVAAPVVTISDLSSLWMIAAVNEADLSRVRPRQSVRISVRAYPDRIFPGTVFQLGERLDPQTRTLQVRVLVNNREALLKPDMFASAEFAAPAQSSGIHVPESAVQELNGKSVVFVQTTGGSFAPRPVRTGARVAGRTEILEGLEAGTPVVTHGALLLKGQLLKSEGN